MQNIAATEDSPDLSLFASGDSATACHLVAPCQGRCWLDPGARNAQVTFLRPVVSSLLNEVEIRNLRVGEAPVNFMLRGRDDEVAVQVLQKNGDVEVMVTK